MIVWEVGENAAGQPCTYLPGCPAHRCCLDTAAEYGHMETAFKVWALGEVFVAARRAGGGTRRAGSEWMGEAHADADSSSTKSIILVQRMSGAVSCEGFVENSGLVSFCEEPA